MARITVEDCLKTIPNRFELVLAATYRARQLVQGHSPRVESRDKATVVALREVAAGVADVRVDRDVHGRGEGEVLRSPGGDDPVRRTVDVLAGQAQRATREEVAFVVGQRLAHRQRHVAARGDAGGASGADLCVDFRLWRGRALSRRQGL